MNHPFYWLVGVVVVAGAVYFLFFRNRKGPTA